MKVRKVIRRRLAHEEDGISVAGGITAAISANVNEPGKTTTRVSSSERIVQGAGRDAPPGDSPQYGEPDEGGRNG